MEYQIFYLAAVSTLATLGAGVGYAAGGGALVYEGGLVGGAAGLLMSAAVGFCRP